MSTILTLTSEFQGLKELLGEIKSRIVVQEVEIDSLRSEIVRLQVAKRPDRPPLRVPKMPRALRSIGVGLVKE